MCFFKDHCYHLNTMFSAWASSQRGCVFIFIKTGPTRVTKVKQKLSFCLQPQLASLCATSSRGRPASCHRPPPQHEASEDQQHAHFTSEPQENPQLGGNDVLPTARSREDGSRSSTDSPSVGSTGDPGETRRAKVFFFLCVRKIDSCSAPDLQTNEWQVSLRLPSYPSYHPWGSFTAGRKKEKQREEQLWMRDMHCCNFDTRKQN